MRAMHTSGVARMPAALRALAALASGFLLVHVAVFLLARAQVDLHGLPAWGWALVVGAASALAARALRLEPWWLAILFAFPPALWAMATLDPPRWLWPLLLLALLALYGATFSTRVPLYLSGPKARATLLGLLPPPGGSCRFLDLGSGLGGLVLSLARERPDGHFTGVELAPLPALVAWLRARSARLPNARLARASLWDQPLAGYDVVHAFLSPVPMPRLWEKALREMKAGSLFVSNSFEVPGHAPDEVIEVGDVRGSRLLCWRMPGGGAKAPG